MQQFGSDKPRIHVQLFLMNKIYREYYFILGENIGGNKVAVMTVKEYDGRYK